MRVTGILLWLAGTLPSGALLAPFCLICVDCGGSRLPPPPYVRQSTAALFEVPYEPPPARTERVPLQPGEDAVWIDGEWTWDGRRWSWKQGRWVVPPRGARFAAWTTVRRVDGALLFAPGVWQDAKGQAIPDPVPAAVARVGSSPLVGPDGEQFPTGATITVGDAGPGAGDAGR